MNIFGLDATPLLAIAAPYAHTAKALERGNFIPPMLPSPKGQTVGVLPIVGTLTKDLCLWILDQLKLFVANPSVGEIVLRIESPGGFVAGTADLASAIAHANSVKPVVAFIEDMGASGAYWLASQAGKVFANRTALVGSIGAYVVMADTSKFWERLGVDWIVIRSNGAGLKGSTVDGVKISAEAVASVQTVVDAIARAMVGDVAKGRKMTVARVSELATGAVFVGTAAVAAGLVDGIKTFDEVLSDARGRTLHAVRGPGIVDAYAKLLAQEEKLQGWKSPHLNHHLRERHPEFMAAYDEHLAAHAESTVPRVPRGKGAPIIN